MGPFFPGWCLDLTADDPDDGKPWDFNQQDKRDKAEEIVKGKRALLVISSPMCSSINQLQNLHTRLGKRGNERLYKSRTCCTTLTVSAGCPTTIPAEPPSQPATKSHHQFDDIFSLCFHLIGPRLSLKKDTTDTKLPQQLPQSLAVLYPV